MNLIVERVREMRRVAWIDRLCQDGGYAVRALRRTPIFTLTAVATLVVGIGANAMMLDVIDRQFVRAPVGIRDAQGIARLWLTRPEPRDYTPVTSYVFYAALRDGLVGAADLATFATYGVVGYLTALQHREAAIRVALGASPHRLAVALLGRAMAAVVLGITAGVGLAVAGGRAVASQLYGVQAFDPVVLSLAATTLLITGVIAAYLPARHLETIEPSTLLRAE